MRIARLFAPIVWLFMAMPLFAQADVTTEPQAMNPAARERMQAIVRDMLIMSQNTAVEIPDGIAVLQGNRLLIYSDDLNLQRTVNLPLPQAATADQDAPLRSMVMTKVIPMSEGGLTIVRGQQVIMLNENYEVQQTAQLPTLPPLSGPEVAVVAPASIYIVMMPMMPGVTMTMDSIEELPTATEPMPVGDIEPAPDPNQVKEPEKIDEMEQAFPIEENEAEIAPEQQEQVAPEQEEQIAPDQQEEMPAE